MGESESCVTTVCVITAAFAAAAAAIAAAAAAAANALLTDGTSVLRFLLLCNDCALSRAGDMCNCDKHRSWREANDLVKADQGCRRQRR